MRELQSDLPLLKLDSGKIGQVFINLFTNAAHAMERAARSPCAPIPSSSPASGANISDSRSESFRVGENIVVAEIDDTGHGIPEDKLAKDLRALFHHQTHGQRHRAWPFGREDDHRSARRHDRSAESARRWRPRDDHVPSINSRCIILMDTEPKKRIFIVDDESGFTRLLKLTLEKTGRFTVLEENDGTKAWLAAREFKPDIIFLDIVMPKIDGGDVAQQIRTDPALAHVPIVFLTAIVSEREGGHTFGGFPFISKPVSLEVLIECIDKHLPPTAI